MPVFLEFFYTLLLPLFWSAHNEHLVTIYELLLFYQATWTINQALPKDRDRDGHRKRGEEREGEIVAGGLRVALPVSQQ